MTNVRGGIWIRFYFSEVLHIFSKFYAFCIVQMPNGNGIKIMVKVRG